jgi:hypothetical protein
VGGVVDERPLVGDRGLDPGEHPVEGAAEFGDLVLPRRLRQPGPGLGHRDRRRLARHPPDGAQGGPGEDPGGGGDRRGQHRAGDDEHDGQPIPRPDERSGARGDDAGDRPGARKLDRSGQHAGMLTDAGDLPVDHDLPAQRAGELVGGEHRRRSPGREHSTVGADDLGQDRARGRWDRSPLHVGDEVAHADRQLVGDRTAQLAADVLIEQERADAEHDHRPDAGEQRQPGAQGEAASHAHAAAPYPGVDEETVRPLIVLSSPPR